MGGKQGQGNIEIEMGELKKQVIHLKFTTILESKSIIKMKTWLGALFISICLIQTGVGAAITCKDGYVDQGVNICYQCHPAYQTCFISGGGLYGVVKSGFTGYTTSTVSGNSYSNLYCYTGTYNSKTNNCDLACATGCVTCNVDTTWCTTCQNGYTWNNYTCLPAVIGLEAASLALLFITLIFTIIGCCYVNKARK